MKDKIQEALGLMDSLNDDEWTADGAPKVSVVAELSGLPDIKRSDIIDAAPKFSRLDFDLTEVEEKIETEEDEVEENTQGYDHPEIIAAQKAYNECAMELAEVKRKEVECGQVLSKVMDRLIRVKQDPQANQREIMRTIKASNKARAGRVAQHQKNRALMEAAAPKSALDTAKAGEKKVRPLIKN